jgi:hypothetical protein
MLRALPCTPAGISQRSEMSAAAFAGDIVGNADVRPQGQTFQQFRKFLMRHVAIESARAPMEAW